MERLPKLNSSVYIITYVDSEPYCITKDVVYMKSANEFITEDMLSDFVIDEYRRPCAGEDYGYTWVKTLKEAKEVVRKYCEDNNIDFTIEKTKDDSWNVNCWRE